MHSTWAVHPRRRQTVPPSRVRTLTSASRQFWSNCEGRAWALVIAQKSGMVHAIDPDHKGSILWQTRAGEGSALGGSQWGSAADARNIYVAISDVGVGGVADPQSPVGFRITVDPKKGGGLHAIDLKTGKIVWSAKPAVCPESQLVCSPAQSAAVTAIPGAVFSGAVDGHLACVLDQRRSRAVGTSTPPGSSPRSTASPRTAVPSMPPEQRWWAVWCLSTQAITSTGACRATCCWRFHWMESDRTT